MKDRNLIWTDVTDKRVLEVGCWGGRNSAALCEAGASQVVGIDIYCNEKLRENIDQYDNFRFLQMDALSTKFYLLPRFDVVVCHDVIYHVQNPMDLLIRLRNKCKDELILSSYFEAVDHNRPIAQFYPEDGWANDYSNWWQPTKACLRKMLQGAGFEVTKEEQYLGNRVGFLADTKPLKLEAIPGRPWHKLDQHENRGERV